MIKKSFQEYIDEARECVAPISVEQAKALLGKPDVQFIDVRDQHERVQVGSIPGAVHATRGMLEFLVDPACPFHKPVFAENKQFIFFCASGNRAVLSAHRAQEMGLDQVHCLDGGFLAWLEGNCRVEIIV